MKVLHRFDVYYDVNETHEVTREIRFWDVRQIQMIHKEYGTGTIVGVKACRSDKPVQW